MRGTDTTQCGLVGRTVKPEDTSMNELSTSSGSTSGPSFSLDELERAIGDDDLLLHYQPTVNLVDGMVTGFEALVRWPHPRLGLLCASTIVPVAERDGLVRSLDDWVLRTALRQLAAWQEDVLVAPGFRLASNVSGAEVDGDGLVQRVRHAISESSVDPRGFVVEITETCAIESIEAGRKSADGLHALGVELALDDFGSQYGTFARWDALPFDVLKIDREFVVGSSSERGRAFVRALVELGGSLGTRIIAEGIETAQQARQLRGLGAHEGQGYFWAPAFSSTDAEALLATGVWPVRESEASWSPKLLCPV